MICDGSILFPPILDRYRSARNPKFGNKPSCMESAILMPRRVKIEFRCARTPENTPSFRDFEWNLRASLIIALQHFLAEWARWG